jgi:hypothetical protein
MRVISDPVSTEDISPASDNYRLLVINSSLISMRIDPAILKRDESFRNAPMGRYIG